MNPGVFLTQLKREVLREMGITVWVRREGGPIPETKPRSEAPVAVSAECLPAAELPSVATLGWDELSSRVDACAICEELASTRTQTVFGVGAHDADWLFIGEAPGAEEDRRGEPFVGRAGQLLDNMLAALGLRHGDNVYIANILKCRPPGNRNPRPDEAAACRGYLDRQIDLVGPRVIVALGRIAAQALLDTDLPLGQLRGGEHRYRETPLVVTYHPAYLLRTPSDKAKAWQDLRNARALMRDV